MDTATDTTTSIDFYLGRGTDARYLGTANHLTHILPPAVFQSLDQDEYTTDKFLKFVAAFASEQTWPHRWESSDESPWTYAYDKGSVYVYHYGVEMMIIRCNAFRTTRGQDGQTAREWRPVNRFPDMTLAHTR